MYDFDKVVDRKNTRAIKWDNQVANISNDVLPMWVADMDFPCPKEVHEAIIKRANHPVFGYNYANEETYNLIVDRIKEKFNWDIKKEWIVFLPGVVDGVASSVQCFSEKGEGVIIQEPVYYPFKSVIESNDRIFANNELKEEENGYIMDYNNLENIIKENKPKMLILCNPHNPVGRVWSKGELEKLGNICNQNNVLVVSDEIHSDIIYSPYEHTIFASISKDFENNSVTFMAPSKTFNVAGLSQAFAIIPNEALRNKFLKVREGMNWGNVFGLTALEACYIYGEEYLKELLVYLEENINYFEKFIKENLPMLKMFKPQGTYMIWLDMRALGMNGKELEDFLINKVKVRFNNGIMFGKCGEGFQRINIGCPRVYIEEALNELKKQVDLLNS